jgi:hypothetical protein
MHRRIYLKRPDCGNLVFDALANNPGGLTMVDLVELTGLTRNQIRSGMIYVREILAGEHGQPIIFQPGKHKNLYKLAAVRVETEEDLRRRCATWLLQIRRAKSAVADPAAIKFGVDGVLPGRLFHLDEDMRRVDVDLVAILKDLNP